MKKENGKVIVGEHRRVIPKDREEALKFYLNELREFNHGEAAEFIKQYTDNLRQYAEALE